MPTILAVLDEIISYSLLSEGHFPYQCLEQTGNKQKCAAKCDSSNESSYVSHTPAVDRDKRVHVVFLQSPSFFLPQLANATEIFEDPCRLSMLMKMRKIYLPALISTLVVVVVVVVEATTKNYNSRHFLFKSKRLCLLKHLGSKGGLGLSWFKR